MKKILQVLIYLAITCTLNAQSFRVIGYLPHYRFDFIDKINFKQITHLNIAFANPDMNGYLTTCGNDIRLAVNKAHQNNVKAMISLAGGYLYPEWKAAWKKNMCNAYRSAFISKIMDYVKQNELDGIDLDLEWRYVDENYNSFVLELRDSLNVYHKLLSAAMPGKFRYVNMNNEALQCFDFINLMAYDATGPWCPRKPGQHSSLEFAESCLCFWTDKQGVDPKKISLGLPFYGYNFNNHKNVYGFYYNSMITRSPDNMYKDQVGGMYYNGIPTIKAKTQMAKERVGGVMLWELSQDALDTLADYSLLGAVNSVLSATPPKAVADNTNTLNFRIYPNPNSHFVYIETQDTQGEAEVHVFDVQGELKLSKTQELTLPVIQLDTANLSAGTYYCTVKVGNRVHTQVFVKS